MPDDNSSGSHPDRRHYQLSQEANRWQFPMHNLAK